MANHYITGLLINLAYFNNQLQRVFDVNTQVWMYGWCLVLFKAHKKWKGTQVHTQKTWPIWLLPVFLLILPWRIWKPIAVRVIIIIPWETVRFYTTRLKDTWGWNWICHTKWKPVSLWYISLFIISASSKAKITFRHSNNRICINCISCTTWFHLQI